MSGALVTIGMPSYRAGYHQQFLERLRPSSATTRRHVELFNEETRKLSFTMMIRSKPMGRNKAMQSGSVAVTT